MCTTGVYSVHLPRIMMGTKQRCYQDSEGGVGVDEGVHRDLKSWDQGFYNPTESDWRRVGVQVHIKSC